ncbi:hypothetical protein [Streptomyces aculeolatus]|nr:hypothetical protein [Streptomyces aculeolatus]
MPVRRLVLDVDKTVNEPDLIHLALVMESAPRWPYAWGWWR